MSDQNPKFQYTYSASQQKEIDKIKKKYISDIPTEQMDKMEQLRRLDASVNKKATIPSLTLGIISTLVMGMGMSLIMTNIGDYIGINAPLLPGIVIGFIGMIGVILAYPLYNHIIKKERKKIAPQILRLIEEVSQQ